VAVIFGPGKNIASGASSAAGAAAGVAANAAGAVAGAVAPIAANAAGAAKNGGDFFSNIYREIYDLLEYIINLFNPLGIFSNSCKFCREFCVRYY
jgi:hypothetical protein